jgi:hypothetical protein
VKYYNYTYLRDTENNKKPYNALLAWEHSTYGLFFVDAANQTKLFYTPDEGVNVDEVDLSDNTNSYKIQAGWLDGNDLWLLMCDNDGTADDFEVCYVEMDDSNDCNPVAVSAGADANTVYATDIFKIGAEMRVINWEDRAGIGTMVVWDVDANPFVELDDQGQDDIQNMSRGGGVVVGTKYWYVFVYDDAGTKKARLSYFEDATDTIAKFNGVDGYQLSTNFSLHGMAYDGSNILYINLEKVADSKNYLHSYSISGDALTSLGEHNVCLMADRNTASGVLEKAFHLTEYKIYQLQNNSTQLNFIANPSLTGAIIAITDNYFFALDSGGNVELWEYEDQINNIISLDFVHEIMDAPFGEIKLKKGAIPLQENMIMKFYDNYTTAGATTETIVFEGLVDSFSDTQLQRVVLISPAKRDLYKKFPSGDYTKDSDGLISQLITDYCDYITAGTLTDGADLGTVTLGGHKTLESILDDMAYFENFVWYLTPTGQLYFNNGTVDTAENFTEASNIWGVIPIKTRGEFNKIKVKGSYVSGAQVVGTGDDDLDSQQRIGPNPIEVELTTLDTSALCDIAEGKLLTRLSKVPIGATFNHLDTTVGMMQPGETITFEFASEGVTISSDQFIINSVVYDHLSIGNYEISDELL